MNRKPKLVTIGIACVFILIGVLGTFVTILPERIGVWSYVAATGILALGTIFRRI
jgi:hypothetical protein